MRVRAPGAAYSWTAFIDHPGRFLFAKESCHFEGRVYADLLVTFFLASGSNVMARKRCLTSVGGFDEAMEPVEDWELWLRVSDRWPFALVPQYQVLYRFGVASASADFDRYEAAVTRIAHRAFDTAPAALRTRRGECLSNAKQHACISYLARSTDPGGRWRAATLLAESVTLHPPALATRRTFALALCWLLLLPVPRQSAAGAARALLRVYGRLTGRHLAELRDPQSPMNQVLDGTRLNSLASSPSGGQSS